MGQCSNRKDWRHRKRLVSTQTGDNGSTCEIRRNRLKCVKRARDIMDISPLVKNEDKAGGLDMEYIYNPTAVSSDGIFSPSSVNLTNSSLGSLLESEPVYSVLEWARDIALGLVLAGLSLVTFVGNAMVLHAVRTERRLQSVSNMFIVSLAIADLIVGLVVMPISAIYIFTVDWLYGVGLCQFWIGVDYTASTASILNLFILSLDRYWSVTSPLRYLRQRTKQRALKMISVVWSVSSLWLIPIIGWHHFEHDGVRQVAADVCDTEYATNTALKIVTGLFNFYLPLAIMYALYSKIFLEIKRRSKMELGQRIAGGESYVAAGGSISDDSDEKQFNDSIPLQMKLKLDLQNGKTVLGRTLSQMSSCSGPRTDLETDTDQTDDDVSRLHKSGYTNMTLVRNTTRDRQPDIYSSDSDNNRVYVYDESVLESTTEKVHRYYSTHEREISRQPADGRSNGHAVDVKNGNGRVRFKVDSEESAKTPVSLPKETHPAKNTYVVKPRHYRNQKLSVESDGDDQPPDTSPARSPSLSPAQRTNNKHPACDPQNTRNPTHNAALVRQAKRWRRKLDKTRHKPSSALSKEIKAAKQLGVIMGAFTVCFLPYFVCFMVVAFCDNCVEPSLMTAVTWIGYLNSTLNPFLYPLCNASFRRKFREMLRLSNESERRRGSVYYTPTRNCSTAGGYDV